MKSVNMWNMGYFIRVFFFYFFVFDFIIFECGN